MEHVTPWLPANILRVGQKKKHYKLVCMGMFIFSFSWRCSPCHVLLHVGAECQGVP